MNHKNVELLKKALAILLLGAIAMAVIYVAVIQPRTPNGYTAPETLKGYGISGREETWPLCQFFGINEMDLKEVTVQVKDTVMLSLAQQEEIDRLTAFLDENCTVVDQRARKVQARNEWTPYTFTFTAWNGDTVSFKISMINELSRVIFIGDKCKEVVSGEDLYRKLEKEFSMLPYDAAG